MNCVATGVVSSDSANPTGTPSAATSAARIKTLYRFLMTGVTSSDVPPRHFHFQVDFFRATLARAEYFSQVVKHRVIS
jgi:hypothetical protein